MSAVKLWKAWQPLLSQWSSVDCSKWTTVGNGEKEASDSTQPRKPKYLPPHSTDFPHLLQCLFTRPPRKKIQSSAHEPNYEETRILSLGKRRLTNSKGSYAWKY